MFDLERYRFNELTPVNFCDTEHKYFSSEKGQQNNSSINYYRQVC
jgi:hypothetical protein